jgi:hypothetical protein
MSEEKKESLIDFTSGGSTNFAVSNDGTRLYDSMSCEMRS